MSVTGVVFLLSYFGGLLSSLAIHPRWGLFTYLAVFYLLPPVRWWGQSLPDLRWSLLAAFITLLTISKAKLPADYPPWGSHGIIKLLIVFVAWMWVQLLWANPSHMEGLILQTKYLVLSYLIYRIIQDIQDVRAFIIAHVIGCFYFGWLAFDASDAGRLEGIGGPSLTDSNALGMVMCTAMLFAASLVLSERGAVRWMTLAMVPFIANGFVQTESRSAFVGLVCGGAVYYLFAPKRRRKYIVVLGTLAIVVLVARSPETYWERISTILIATDDVQEMDSSARSRIALFNAQVQIFYDNPFGLGFRTTSYLSNLYVDPEFLPRPKDGRPLNPHSGRSSHNTLASIPVDQGVPGLILMLCGIYCITMTAARLLFMPLAKLPEQYGLYIGSIAGSLATMFTSGVFVNFIKAEIWIWFITLLLIMHNLTTKRCIEENLVKASRNPMRYPTPNRRPLSPSAGAVGSTASHQREM